MGKSNGKEEDGKEPQKEGTFAATDFTFYSYMLHTYLCSTYIMY